MVLIHQMLLPETLRHFCQTSYSNSVCAYPACALLINMSHGSTKAEIFGIVRILCPVRLDSPVIAWPRFSNMLKSALPIPLVCPVIAIFNVITPLVDL